MSPMVVRMSRVQTTILYWLFGLCVGFGMVASAKALEWLPEFASLSEEEARGLDELTQFNSEYQSDLLSYTKPFAWHYDWLSHLRAMDLSIGSISGKHFHINHRWKLQETLHPGLQFRWTWFDQHNFADRQQHQIIELLFPLAERWSFSAYGEADYLKRRNDFGGAILFRPQENHEIRVFRTLVDFVRNERNIESDYFISPFLPLSSGLVGRWWSSTESQAEEFWQYAVREESLVKWAFPSEGRLYSYQARFLSLLARRQTESGGHWNGQIEWTSKIEQEDPLAGTSTVSTRSFSSEHLIWTVQYERPLLLPMIGDTTTTLGLQGAMRRWLNQNQEAFQQYDYIPHLMTRVPLKWTETPLDSLDVAMHVAHHRSWGNSHLKNNAHEDGKLETRMDWAYVLNFAGKAELRFIFTFDLDNLSYSDGFQGGCGQMTLWF